MIMLSVREKYEKIFKRYLAYKNISIIDNWSTSEIFNNIGKIKLEKLKYQNKKRKK